MASACNLLNITPFCHSEQNHRLYDLSDIYYTYTLSFVMLCKLYRARVSKLVFARVNSRMGPINFVSKLDVILAVFPNTTQMSFNLCSDLDIKGTCAHQNLLSAHIYSKGPFKLKLGDWHLHCI